MTGQEIRIELGERSYPVHVGAGVLSSLAKLLTESGLSRDVVVVSDRNVAKLYLSSIRRQLAESGISAEYLVLPPGEKQKSLAVAGRIYTSMLQRRVGRSATIVAVGGGVIGDLAGFVAATYHRGIRLVHVPTTLLAQVDSSIGGKTGVNHPLGKNLIGAFYQPAFVLADTRTLRTLPVREIFCGMGEVVKYGIILDNQLFQYLEISLDKVIGLDEEALVHVGTQCIRLKAGLVSRDERESGERIVLNCGHTIGHALEAAGGYRTLKHGEAVLLGLLAESVIAKEMGIMDPSTYERIAALILRIPLNVKTPAIKVPTVLAMIPRDKKTLHGKNRFVLPIRIGETKVVENVSPSLIKQALSSVRKMRFQSSVT